MDRMQATPRGAISGLLADAMFGGLNYMKDPRRTQQMQGLAAMLESTGVPAVVDRISYGEPLTTGRGMTTQMRPETENTLMAALGMTPVGKPAQAGAMALGRAGERVGMAAEKALEAPLQRAYDKGGLPREMLLAMGQNTVSPATVFHGSPHLFNKFDSSKIGTGEGAQAFGHGLYLAESPNVAGEYAKMLQKPTNSMFAEEALEKINPQLLQKLRGATGGDKYSSNAGKAYMRPSDFNLPPELKKEVLAFKKNSSNLYQVDLPDEQIAKMLDYDKPLSEQPKIVQDFLLKNPDVLDYISKAESQRVKLNEMSPMRLEKLKSASIPFDASRMTGKDAMTAIAQRSGLGKTAEAENMLRQAGIPGIRYLDQGSRAVPNITNKRLAELFEKHGGNADAAVDEMMRSVYNTPKKKEAMREQFMKQLQTPKTSNFVVFPGMEDMLRIEQINNQPVESLFRSLGR